MARKVKETNLDTQKARAQLQLQLRLEGADERRMFWYPILTAAVGRYHLGYQPSRRRWVLRSYKSKKYSVTPLGFADDERTADGKGVLTFEQAYANALTHIARESPEVQPGKLTTNKVETLLRQGQFRRHGDGHGLYLQISNRNSGNWLFRYERDHKERWLGLGGTDTFNLHEARMRARRARQQLEYGIDPIDAKKEETEHGNVIHRRRGQRASEIAAYELMSEIGAIK